MSDKELATSIIAQYMALLRIEKADNIQKEIGNQKRELQAKLEAMGIPVAELRIE